MNPEVRDKWTAALRSGEYEQQRGGVLRSLEGKFCCLGVLCQIATDEGVTTSERLDTNPGYLFGNNSYAYIRDKAILNWAGLGSATSNDQIDLAGMNDSGKTFNEIADYIEENL